ncbi:hypothetical protein B0H14DRAFT_1049086 [Mycena olivaceomarginata]|nr:hypothetical protein B0H14DRAFT_1049086 [Mycena olivaceomarginata]
MHDLPPSGARGVLLTPTIRLRIGPVVQYQRTSALPLEAKYVSATQPRMTRGREGEWDCVGHPCRSFPFSIFLPYPGWIRVAGFTRCRIRGANLRIHYLHSSSERYTVIGARPGVRWSPSLTSLYSPLCGALSWRRNIWIAAGMKHAGPLSGRTRKHTGRSGDLTALNRLWLASAEGIEARSWQWIQVQTWTGRGTRAWRKRGDRQTGKARMPRSCTRSCAKGE